MADIKLDDIMTFVGRKLGITGSPEVGAIVGDGYDKVLDGEL